MILASVLALAVAGASGAASADRFKACARLKHDQWGCHENTLQHPGERVFLGAKVPAARAGDRAALLERKPGREGWRKVATVIASPRGKLKWTWHTTKQDENWKDEYGFRFRLRGEGFSNNVLIWLIPGT